MAKEKSPEKVSSKKSKKEKRADTEGVHKPKKDKKKSKSRDLEENDVEMEVEAGNGAEPAVASSSTAPPQLLAAFVPFAHPMADEKAKKKVLKTVKKATKSKALKRGVKEVVKALRKSPTPGPTSTSTPVAIVILAADISPMDVISHIPVLCEDHGIPYIFVPSRAELGAAGNTKRPTSVVMIGKDSTKSKKEKTDGEESTEDWEEVYAELVKVVKKAGKDIRI